MDSDYQLFTLMSRIDRMSNQFTKTDWKIVQYIKKNTQDFLDQSAQELAKAIGTSDASIIRFSQKVGFSGLNELKYTMQRELHQTPVSRHSDYSSLLHDYQMLLDTTFSSTNPNVIDKVRLMMKKAERIFIVGLELNRYVADITAHKFVTLGLNIQAVTNYDTLKLYQPLAKKGDLFFTITLSGNHKMLSSILEQVHKQGSQIILVSNYEKSLCSAQAEEILLVPKTDLLKNSNTISREILVLFLLDMLFHNFLTEDTEAYDTFQKTAPYAKGSQDDAPSGLARFIDML